MGNFPAARPIRLQVGTFQSVSNFPFSSGLRKSADQKNGSKRGNPASAEAALAAGYK
jgi:hypothetical protein